MVHIYAVPVFEQNGEVSGFIEVVEDITERKRAEESLRRSEEETKRLANENAIIAEIGRIISSTLDIEAVYDRFAEEVKKLIPFDRIGISIIDWDSQTVTMAYIAGHDVPDLRKGDRVPFAGSISEELIKQRSGILMDTDRGKEGEWIKRFPSLLSTFRAGIRSMVSVPLLSKDQVIGGLHFHSLLSTAYSATDIRLAEKVGNQIAGAIANAQLYIQHERSERERMSLQEQLQQSQKMEAIGQLAGGVAHDFNNLLTVITTQCQLSRLKLIEGELSTEDLKVIEQTTDRAANLTRQLLAFSRRQILELKVINLNTLVENLKKTLPGMIGEHIAFRSVLAYDLGMLTVDPGQMEQVIINLVINARYAMPGGGILIIETANVKLSDADRLANIGMRPGAYVVLSMTDTGVGMSKEVKNQIFEPF